MNKYSLLSALIFVIQFSCKERELAEVNYPFALDTKFEIINAANNEYLFNLPEGIPILAIDNGMICYSVDTLDSSNKCVLMHRNGTFSIYDQLEKGVGMWGDIMKCGDTIGYSSKNALKINIKEHGWFPNAKNTPVQFSFDKRTENSAPSATSRNEFPLYHTDKSSTVKEKLNLLDEKLKSNAFGELHGLLVSKNDSVVFEGYYNGSSANENHVLFSATKSFVSTAVGIAYQKGYIKSLDQPLKSFYKPSHFNDSLKNNLTVRHLLNMQVDISPEDDEMAYNSENWIDSMLKIPMQSQPGSGFYYRNVCTEILADIVSESSNLSFKDFIDEALFQPLNIDDYYWTLGPNDEPTASGAGGGLHVNLTDMTKLGLLYLNNGVWENEKILDPNWVALSQDHANKDVKISGTRFYMNYGFQWWSYIDESFVARKLRTNDVYFAFGHLNQRIVVIPHLNAVISITGNSAKIDKILVMEVLPILYAL